MRPQIISQDFSQIPHELQELPIWLLWQHRLVDGSWTKVPLIADDSGRYAKVNDPDTWRHIDDALKHVARANGLGLRFIRPYCGLDLDKCRDKTTEEVADWAQKLVERFDSYTELSPSGEGLHIIIALTEPLPSGCRKRGGKELGWEVGLYDETSPRYFCVTGRVVGDRRTIRCCDPSTFYPQFNSGVWDVTRSNRSADPKPNHHSGNGHDPTARTFAPDKLERLKRGQWEGLYSSQSEADLALVSYLAKQFHNDAVLIDRAFRVSGLMRAKWDEPRPDGTYGSITIAKVLAEEPQIVAIGERTRPDMPESVLDGRLGEIYQRRMKAAALAYAWGPLLTIAGTSLFLKYQGQAIRGNLYCCSVGDPGSGKSAEVELALHIWGLGPLNPILLRAKYGSAEGLASDLKDAGSCVRLLLPDELSHLLRKCAIEHSSFPTVLTTAFYEDRQRGGTKKDAWEIDCRLSILGGVVEDDFEDAFGFASVSGLYDRFLFGLAPRPYSYEYYPPSGSPEPISPAPPEVSGDVWEVRNEWRKDGISGRVAEICLRAAWICAAVDGRPALRGCDLGPAHALAEYQMEVRTLLKPNPGQNPDAQCAVSVLNWLQEYAPEGRWVLRRDLSRSIHSYRLGPGVFHRALQNLQFNDEVELDLDRKLVRLVPEVGESVGDAKTA